MSPLLSIDGHTIDAVIKCHIDQLERLVPVMMDVPSQVAPHQRVKVEVPQITHCRLHERFRWPTSQVLLVGLGVVPTPVPTDPGPLKVPMPWSNSGSRRLASAGGKQGESRRYLARACGTHAARNPHLSRAILVGGGRVLPRRLRTCPIQLAAFRSAGYEPARQRSGSVSCGVSSSQASAAQFRPWEIRSNRCGKPCREAVAASQPYQPSKASSLGPTQGKPATSQATSMILARLEGELKKAIRKGLKVMCRESQMGVAAAQRAIHDAGLAPAHTPGTCGRRLWFRLHAHRAR